MLCSITLPTRGVTIAHTKDLFEPAKDQFTALASTQRIG
jgi:hypothetical protein